jgi:hypothetical protein
MAMPTLPIPPHFDASTVGNLWRAPYQQCATEAEEWARRHSLPPAASDPARVCLLLVDRQNTFCIPDFELFVAGHSGLGAVEDNDRLCEFIYRNLPAITHIIPTLDTHTAMQIFHPLFWVDEQGAHPQGGRTVISLDDVTRGKWKVNSAVAEGIMGGDPRNLPGTPLLRPVMAAGKRLAAGCETLHTARDRACVELKNLPERLHALTAVSPPYEVQISPNLQQQMRQMASKTHFDY